MSIPRAIAAVALLTSTGCTMLPGAGPSAGAIRESSTAQGNPDVQIVNVTPADALALQDALRASQNAEIDRTLASLRSMAVSPSFTFGPGATMDIALWSVSPWVEASASSSPSSLPGSIALGSYTVASDGAIILPYVGKVAVGGRTLQQAEDAITRRFAALNIVQKPSVTINVRSAPQGQVLVTGSLGQPRLLPWSPAGMTLADAVTQAFGDGNAILGQSTDLAMSGAAVQVELLRDGMPPAHLPISVALERQVPLRPGDRIVVTRAPAVKVTVLGGGIKRNGVYDFAEAPSLSEVLARASGLDGNAANDHAIFILRTSGHDKPVLYDFAWNRLQGLIASHDFEITNGDLVYVAEAPIVPIQRVLSTLFQLALPAEVAQGF
jgi:polysaccharide biosynthesis/export protein